MASTVVRSRALRQSLRAQEIRYPKVLADALNRTAFEILDAEKEHVGSIFDFAGGTTRNFLSGRGSFAFTKATARRQRVRIFPKRRAASILSQHLRGRSTRQDPKTHLTVDVKGERFIAMPIDVKRSARGRVAKARTPRQLLRSRAFVSRSGQAIVARKSPRSKKFIVAYALLKAPKNPDRFRFQQVARVTAAREFAAKARRAVEKFKEGTRR